MEPAPIPPRITVVPHKNPYRQFKSGDKVWFYTPGYTQTKLVEIVDTPCDNSSEAWVFRDQYENDILVISPIVIVRPKKQNET